MRNVLHGSYTYFELAACMVAWLPLLAAAHLRHRHDPVPRIEGRWMRRFGRATLVAGLPVMLFPEGTRSRDGELRPFKDGAFRLAIETQVPVLPIAIEGTRDCRPKGSWWFGRARAKARILAPVPTHGLGAGDVASLRETVRGRIAAAHAS